jgi:hypothetical protein
MEERTNYERPKNYKHEHGASIIIGQRVDPPVCTAKTARGIRSGGHQIVVAPLI